MTTMEKFCPSIETLAGWLEGSLAPEARGRVASHLASCDDCRRTVALVSTTEPVAAAAPVNEILLSRVVSASRRRSFVPLAAAAAVVLSIVGITMMPSRSRHEAAAPAVVAVKTDAPAPVVADPPKPAPVAVRVPDPVVAPVPVDPVKETPVVIVPKETPVPVRPPVPTENPKVPDVVAPAPVKEPPVVAAAPEDKSRSPVFVMDPVGDLWLRRDQGEAKAGVLEKAAWKDLFAARTGAASFSLEARTSVMLEKGSEVAFSHLKLDDTYSLALGQGLVMLDTEGSSQKWRISFGKSELDFSNLNGRLAVESRGDRMSALLLDGSAELKIGELTRKAQVGQEVVLSREGQIVEQKVETQKKLARLDELRPKIFTSFNATFDEKKDEFQPYPYSLAAGRVMNGPAGMFLQADPIAPPRSGDKGQVASELHLDRPFGVITGMVVRFRYRTTLPVFSVKIGKYSSDYTSRVKAGQWADAEIPLREFSFEGTPLLPTDPVEGVRFAGVVDRRSGQLDIDGVQFLRRVR